MMEMVQSGTALLLIILERCPRFRFLPSPLIRSAFTTDVIYLLTGFVAGGVLAMRYITYGSEWVGGACHLPRLAAIHLPFWLSVMWALVILDLGNYVAHYLLHRFAVLWEFHKIHHSSPTLDWLATFRSHLVEQALRRLVAPLLLIVLGFPLPPVMMAGGIFIAWAMFNHSNLRLNLRMIEPVLITPRLHRVHHLPQTAGRNLGTVFTCWDQLRGNLVFGEIGEESPLGNGEPDYPQHWLAQLVEPVRSISHLRPAVSATPDPTATSTDQERPI